MAEKKSSLGKKIVVGLGIFALAFAGVKGVNHLEEKDLIDLGGGIHFQQTEEPQSVTFENNILSWKTQHEDTEYIIKCDGNTYKTTEDSYDFSELAPGEYDIKIKATSDGKRDSDYVKLEDCIVMTEQQVKEKVSEDVKEAISDINQYFEGITPICFEIEGNKLKVLVVYHSRYAKDIDIYSEYSFDIPEGAENINKYITRNNATLNFEVHVAKTSHSIKNTDFSNIELIGNLERLEDDGWKVDKVLEELTVNTYDFDAQCLWGEYLIIAKCQKGDEVKYAYQLCKVPQYTDSPSETRFQDMFEAGKFNDSMLQNQYNEISEDSYINLNFITKTNSLEK